LAIVAGALLHTKPPSAGNFQSFFTLVFSLAELIPDFQSAELQLLNRPHTFWKYFVAWWSFCVEILV